MGTGVVNPENPTQAAHAAAGSEAANDVADTASGIGATISNFFGSLFGGDDDAAAGDEDEAGAEAPAGGSGARRRGGFKWGPMIAGLVGVLGAYLGSSIFGGGWLGTVMFALLAIPAFMMGRNGLGDTFSGWFGEEPSEPSASQGNERALARDGAGGPAADQTVPPTLTIAQRKEMASLSNEAFARISNRQIQAGDMPRRSVDEVRALNQQLNGLVLQVHNAPNDAEAERALGAVDQFFERLNSQAKNAPLRADMEREIAAIRASRGQGAAVAASESPVPVTSYSAEPTVIVGPSTYTRPVTFSGAPTNTIGANLSPDAQAQLDAMRNQTNYAYQPAQPGIYEPQRFNSLPTPAELAVMYGTSRTN